MLKPDGNMLSTGKINFIPLDTEGSNPAPEDRAGNLEFSTELDRASELYTDKLPTQKLGDEQNETLVVVEGERPEEPVDFSASRIETISSRQASGVESTTHSIDGQLLDQASNSPLMGAKAANDFAQVKRSVELDTVGDVMSVPAMPVIEGAPLGKHDAVEARNVPSDTILDEPAVDLGLVSSRPEVAAKSVKTIPATSEVAPARQANIVNTSDLKLTPPADGYSQISSTDDVIVKTEDKQTIGARINGATTVVARAGNLEPTIIAPQPPGVESQQNNTVLTNSKAVSISNKTVVTPSSINTNLPVENTEIRLPELSSKIITTPEGDSADPVSASWLLGKTVTGQKSVELSGAATVNDNWLPDINTTQLTGVGSRVLPPSVNTVVLAVSDEAVAKTNEVTISPQVIVENKITPGLPPVPVTATTVTLTTAARESLEVERHNKLADVRSGVPVKRTTSLRSTIDVTSLQSHAALSDTTSSNMYHVTTSGTISAISPQQSTGLPGDSVIAPRTVLLDRPDADQTLVDNVRWAVNEKLSRASVNVTPANLGPITVNVDVENQTMSVSIITNSSVAKEAIDSLLPRMREHFTSEGYQQVSVDVSSQQDRQSAAKEHMDLSLETEIDEGEDSRTTEVINGEQDVKSTSMLAGNSRIDTYV